MDSIRILSSLLAFCTGCYLIYDLFSVGFNVYIFLGIFVSFILAHYLWPQDRNKKDEDFDLLDIVEIIVDLPFKTFSQIIRSLGRSGRDSDGIDFDID